MPKFCFLDYVWMDDCVQKCETECPGWTRADCEHWNDLIRAGKPQKNFVNCIFAVFKTALHYL